MKTIVHASISIDSNLLDSVMSCLGEYVVKERIHSGGTPVVLVLSVPSERWEYVSHFCADTIGSVPLGRVESVYTRREIESAEYCLVQVDRAPAIRELEWLYRAGISIKKHQSIWSHQLRNVYVPNLRLASGNEVLETQFGETLVSVNLWEEAKASSLLSAFTVRAVTTGKLHVVSSEYRQLCSELIPPPFDSESSGLLDVTSDSKLADAKVVCETRNEGLGLKYSRDLIQRWRSDEKVDVFFSYELFGEPDWNDSMAALNAPTPRLVVSKAGMRGLLQLQVRRLRFIPIELV